MFNALTAPPAIVAVIKADTAGCKVIVAIETIGVAVQNTLVGLLPGNVSP
jgi:hypothetical protein